PFDSYDINFIKKNFGTLLALPLVPFWLIACLTAFGAVTAGPGQKKETAIILSLAFVYMISVVMFYVTDRYRLMVVIFLLPVAGAAASGLSRVIKEKNWRRLVIASLFAVVIVLISFLPPVSRQYLEAFDWGTLSTIYADLHQDPDAIGALNKAIA